MRTKDGYEIKSATPEGIVAELHKMSHAPCATDREFMRETAGRARLQTGYRVRYGSAANFVDDLVSCGLLFED
jgi:adenine deaminase